MVHACLPPTVFGGTERGANALIPARPARAACCLCGGMPVLCGRGWTYWAFSVGGTCVRFSFVAKAAWQHPRT